MIEFIAIGFLFGVVFTFVIAGVGVIYADRVHKIKPVDDSDMRFYVFNRDRHRSNNK